MDNHEMKILSEMVLAPWIQKSFALKLEQRKVGGNQFRHCFAVLGILIDYQVIDPVILKASVIHDLLEDAKDEKDKNEQALRVIDSDSEKVLELVKAVSYNKDEESKTDFLLRILNHPNDEPRILKMADRISNLTDLHQGIFSDSKIEEELIETKEIILKMPEAIKDQNRFGKVAQNMEKELISLIKNREELIRNQNIADIVISASPEEKAETFGEKLMDILKHIPGVPFIGKGLHPGK
jgi:hypothetical protein